MFEIATRAPMGHSGCCTLDDSRDQHDDFELADVSNNDVLDTVRIHPICNQLSQFPLCNVHHPWQPDELH
jgi:hypothetical protein